MSRRRRRKRQPSLFDPDKAKERKEQAMEAVDAHVPPTLKMQWLDIIHEICKTMVFFTTDDVVRLGLERGLVEPAEARAFGPFMQAAAKNGWCRPTHADRKSERVRLHQTPLRIWASLLSPTETATCPHCHGYGIIGVTP